MDDDFLKRQEAAKARINEIDREALVANPRREDFFETVYGTAHGDAAMVPWADMAPKPHLLQWLGSQPTHRGRAIDVACGLGDNAEALAAAGYETLAFDFSPRAIAWARERFEETQVDYQVGDLFDLPEAWQGAFDLVHECYTLQSIPPETLPETLPAVAGLVAPGGILLVYARTRKDGEMVEGPPWPLEESMVRSFDRHGLEPVSHEVFATAKGERTIPHIFSIWRRPA